MYATTSRRRPCTNRNNTLITETQTLNHRPRILPMIPAPMQSYFNQSSQSNHGRITGHPYNGPTLAHFRAGYQIRAATNQANSSGVGSVDRYFVWFDLNRQQGNSVLTQGFLLLCDETFVVGRFQSSSQAPQTLF